MADAHFICRKSEDGSGRLHLEKQDDGTWTSGLWLVPVEDAEKLMGGIVYLHDTKKTTSGFGGKVLGYEVRPDPAGGKHNRITFRLAAFQGMRGVKWRGRSDVYAHYSGIV